MHHEFWGENVKEQCSLISDGNHLTLFRYRQKEKEFQAPFHKDFVHFSALLK